MDHITHLDQHGNAHMVDVCAREITVRTAVATGRVVTTAEVLSAIGAGTVPKGDVAAVTRIAGILGAKQTPALIPLCHPIALHGVEIAVELLPDAVGITATTRTADRTGVEMEALTAVAIAGLTVIDMVKALDPHAVLTDVCVVRKTGGRKGPWSRTETP